MTVQCAGEQRNTSMVAPPEADLFREAKDQIVLLEYLAKQHKAADGQFAQVYHTQGAEALAKLQKIVAQMLGTLFLKGD